MLHVAFSLTERAKLQTPLIHVYDDDDEIDQAHSCGKIIGGRNFTVASNESHLGDWIYGGNWRNWLDLFFCCSQFHGFFLCFAKPSIRRPEMNELSFFCYTLR